MLHPVYCRGCGAELLHVDLGLGSFRVSHPLRDLLIATYRGWAELRCPDCGTHNRLETVDKHAGRKPSLLPPDES